MIKRGDSNDRRAYRLIHHEIAADGRVGAANVQACIYSITVLNGGHGGVDITAPDHPGVWRHLASHMVDASLRPADLIE